MWGRDVRCDQKGCLTRDSFEFKGGSLPLYSALRARGQEDGLCVAFRPPTMATRPPPQRRPETILATLVPKTLRENVPPPNIVVETLKNGKSGDVIERRWTTGRFLGKGGFARCYALQDERTGAEYAAKIVSKALLNKPHKKSKLLNEIRIHHIMRHQHIVRFEHYFEDTQNVYILLELCKNGSMAELLKRRTRLAENEVRFFMAQIISAMQYMHSHNVIHRDVKLGNLLLTSGLDIKIGDFGLATQLEHPNQRKKSLCGTPNYIAPEVLDCSGGHGFEVDVWSLGVCMFTLLVGKPPFETANVKDTYERIKATDYTFPDDVPLSSSARDLIGSIFNKAPGKRPSLSGVLEHRFFTEALPSSAENQLGHEAYPCSSQPKTRHVSQVRQPLQPLPSEKDQEQKGDSVNEADWIMGRRVTRNTGWLLPGAGMDRVMTKMAATTLTSARSKPLDEPLPTHPIDPIPEGDECEDSGSGTTVIVETSTPSSSRTTPSEKMASCSSSHGADLSPPPPRSSQSTSSSLSSRPVLRPLRALPSSSSSSSPPEVEAPSVWITKWVDYSSKYGLGYRLSDGSTGVCFNDATIIAFPVGRRHFFYVDRRRPEMHRQWPLTRYPPNMAKKVALLRHFTAYLDGENVKGEPTTQENPNNGSLSNLTFVKKWMKTKHAMFFRLSSRVIQVNFFDGTEALLPNGRYPFTFRDKDGIRRTYEQAEDPPPVRAQRRFAYIQDVLDSMRQRSSRIS